MPAGAGSGIGAARPEPGREGAVVSLVARRRDRLEGPAEKIHAEGGKALAVEAGIAEQDRAAAAVEHVVAQLGGLHILVPTRRCRTCCALPKPPPRRRGPGRQRSCASGCA
ncbi:SDR family NAD(P)-dependent oxidoreductase [Streptomyces sp. NPDC059467]|uniref:SDR family NAD(P)-dependent oxidoreductase n=1 Tax=Streptomyces sp. NPDC059467 TaxID=3346844 RepID=UPI0036C1F53A